MLVFMRLLGGCLLMLLAAPLWAMQFALSVADIAAPGLAARGMRAVWAQDGSADLYIAELQWADKTWRKTHVHCAEFVLDSVRMSCRRGTLEAAPDLGFDFGYNFSSRRLELAVSSANGERWQVDADFHAQPWRADVQLRNAQGKRVAQFLPPAWSQFAGGVLNGTLGVQGDGSQVSRVNADLQLAGLAFADAAGLHAAEKLAGTLRLEATRSGTLWDWRGTLVWKECELFWQPLYLRGGYTLQASGQWDGARLQIHQAEADLAEVGKLELAGVWDMKNSALIEGAARGNNLALNRLFADFARPFLGAGLLAASELSGRGDVDLQYRDGAMQALSVVLRDAELNDGKKRFLLRGVNASVPWRADARSQAEVSLGEGRLWGTPVGAATFQVAMHGQDFSAAEISLPVFDGKLSVRDLHLRNEGGAWQWDFVATLSPVSMPQVSAALHWPEMHGALSGMIPKVSYRNKLLKADGALLFRVFDGTVVASRIELFDPFGRMPRLSGDLDMRDLDLDLLTRTFSFGNIQGRIDLSVNGLELMNWQPVRFDARLASSPGEYRKRISQKAVENISALGGGGGTAVLQRSYLRVFETFGYSRIGLSCTLRNDVCTMDGVEETGSGAYTIVKGGGIPAINVLGYNHKVGWNELLTRLKRVLQDNMQAVVK